MYKIASSLKNIDLRDIFVTAGVLMIGYGFWAWYAPIGYIVFGGFVFTLSYWKAK